MSATRNTERSGPLGWMSKNPVAANLLMMILVVGGLLFASTIKQEVFPKVSMDMVSVSVVYPGAGPEEVEAAITLAVEDAVRGVDGVKNVNSTSSEGMSQVSIELISGTNVDQALNKIKAGIDRIASFPVDAERPTVTLATSRSRILTLVVSGNFSKSELRTVSEEVREGLEGHKNITHVELEGAAPREIGIEISQRHLRAYGLTLDGVAATIRAGSVELPAGEIRTESGGILLRTTERKQLGPEFAELAVISNTDGTTVRLGDIATIVDGFEDIEQYARFNGEPALLLRIYSVGKQTPLQVADAVREYIKNNKAKLGTAKLTIWQDDSEAYAGRMDLLVGNALLGLALVFITLGLFLEIRLAFWVTLGIPISFLGSFLIFPSVDITLNMISMFAFILTLGIVVDDAIVVGEAVHARRVSGLSPAKAAIAGVRDVATPVVFSVLTSVAAFSPLLFIPGPMGKFFRVIPVVVITVLLLSLVEALLILPAHLGHESGNTPKGILGSIHALQQRFSHWFERRSQRILKPIVSFAVVNRPLVFASTIGVSLCIVGAVAGGRVPMTFMPTMAGDVVTAKLTMPYGTPLKTTEANEAQIRQAAQTLLDEIGGPQSRGMLSQIGSTSGGGGPGAQAGGSGAHLAEVSIFLPPAHSRIVSAKEFAKRWRELVGDIAGTESLLFDFETGIGAGADISIQLSHSDQKVLESASEALAATLREYPFVTNVDDGFSTGKRQLNFALQPAASALGITANHLARQVRNSFYGAQASRQIRGRDEIRVMVRLPKSERSTLASVEDLLIRTASGSEVPLAVAAKIHSDRSFIDIKRRDSRRVATIEARVEGDNSATIMADMQANVLPALKRDFPGLASGQAGQQEQQAETMGALSSGFLMAIFVIYALLAVPLKSYIQPLIIMSAIPFGVVGAVLGHILMGFSLSIMSVMGIVAVAGVVVNDSLVLLTTINKLRSTGLSAHESAIQGALRRFRPIMLTSLTTFVGLAPMLMETSQQARFLIPMAVSVAFGVAFSTMVILFLVPALYLTVDRFTGKKQPLSELSKLPL